MYPRAIENAKFCTAGLGGGELKKYISKQKGGVCFMLGVSGQSHTSRQNKN